MTSWTEINALNCYRNKKKVKNWIGNPCKWLNEMNIHFLYIALASVFFTFFSSKNGLFKLRVCKYAVLQFGDEQTYNALNEDFSFVCSFASAFSNSIKNSFTSKSNMVTQTHFQYLCFNCNQYDIVFLLHRVCLLCFC